jgi:hypothetical protein
MSDATTMPNHTRMQPDNIRGAVLGLSAAFDDAAQASFADPGLADGLRRVGERLYLAIPKLSRGDAAGAAEVLGAAAGLVAKLALRIETAPTDADADDLADAAD